jgi:hypothetical protein
MKAGAKTRMTGEDDYIKENTSKYENTHSRILAAM